MNKAKTESRKFENKTPCNRVHVGAAAMLFLSGASNAVAVTVDSTYKLGRSSQAVPADPTDEAARLTNLIGFYNTGIAPVDPGYTYLLSGNSFGRRFQPCPTALIKSLKLDRVYDKPRTGGLDSSYQYLLVKWANVAAYL